MNQTIYLPEWLLSEIKRQAQMEQRSISGYIRYMLTQSLPEGIKPGGMAE